MSKEQIEKIKELLRKNPYVSVHDNLADILAQYLYNEGCRKQSEWISVEERLPEDEDSLVIVIVSGIVGKHRNIHLIKAYGLATYCSAEGWILEEYPEVSDLTVHAWMPLPEPPKGE